MQREIKSASGLTKQTSQWFAGLQDSICQALERIDGKAKFKEDTWERPGGGGGRSRILEQGAIIEKGGVNFSAVFGEVSEKMQEKMGFPKAHFFATGVSIVLHPQNPWMPIIHMNVRYFDLSIGKAWFGGGIDLTPHYVAEEDARFFHQHLKQVCDKHDKSYYPEFKQWADDYFYIPHRQETRGIGGIFFDRLQPDAKHSWDDCWAFVQAVGEAFVPAYAHFAHQYSQKSFTEAQKQWQWLRRGRYVEFNLVYDQGTKFGLETDGRIESILMSLPQFASWQYNHQPSAGSPEAKTLQMLKKGINWAV
ncbi:MAG TPA: oxygen-dependent coproporphyrinogen oxidase [Microscillaceae bacterium]|jgi:coproporphyrinogen III oxidase|nr:oxygen-dependent coproporphyrinogen oxidase [Microscillaceae bacterium]